MKLDETQHDALEDRAHRLLERMYNQRPDVLLWMFRETGDAVRLLYPVDPGLPDKEWDDLYIEIVTTFFAHIALGANCLINDWFEEDYDPHARTCHDRNCTPEAIMIAKAFKATQERIAAGAPQMPRSDAPPVPSEPQPIGGKDAIVVVGKGKHGH